MNIWSIQNRPLRVAVTWALLLAAVLLAIAAIPLFALWLVFVGTVNAFWGAWLETRAALQRPEWRHEIIRPLWRAATGKNEE